MGSLVDTILGSDINYVTLAVPFFFLLIGVELIAGLIQRKRFYRFNDSINDLSCGIIDQTVGIVLKGALFTGYLYLFEHARLFDIAGASPAMKWIAAGALVLGVDFCFYWFHRIAHEYAAPWATHVVHHQSEEYNLTVALRQSALEGCFAWVFYLPLAVLGFPPAWYLAMSGLNLIYQFWVHTEAVGKLGPLEWVLNTPSHHRVHHARNPQYLDKNYAGMFIVWDRMFGTFEPEREEPVYGLTKPLHSWNPLWANLHAWVDLAQTSWRAPRWTDKIKVWFMPLGWTPPGLREGPRSGPITRQELVKYDPRLSPSLNWYVLAHFVVTLLLSLAVLKESDSGRSAIELLAPIGLVLWSLTNLGGILERRRWVLVSEPLRIAALVALAWLYPPTDSRWPAVAGAALLAAVSLVWLGLYRDQFRPTGGENSVAA